MERAWLKPKWKYDDLNDKTVQFRLTAPTHWVEGVGRFRIHINGDKIAVDIVVPHWEESRGYDNLYHLLTDDLANRIEPHHDKSVADYVLIA